MKKILSLVLALLMSASAASMIGAAEDAAIAEDAAVETTAAVTTETTQYDEAIRFLHEYGIYKGKSATDLAAADPIERYQMALFVARISTGWVDDAKWAVADQWYDRDHDTSGFDDLEGTPATNYLGALSYASQKGIIEGYGNKKFGPTDGITYQNALTMIVRTLGYTNLSWPWGYIEKAVTLGLTVGIPSSVKYTDELNRGEVAQLIYNALFIPTKEGDTLAARNFNGELGWETIIITVAGRGRYIADSSKIGKDLASDAKNDIGFNVVKEDGTLDATTYYVKNDDEVSFHFEDHKERFLGYAYKALFTKDENSNYVTLISAKSLQEGNIIWNKGLPTKDADGKYPITKALEGVTLVSKFSKNTYLNTLNGEYGIKEYILKNALEGSTVTVDAGRKYAIDWTTGNILQVNTDGKGVIKTSGLTYKDNGVEYKDITYDVAWYYNELLNQYFRFKTVQKGSEIEFVGIDVLDPADLQNIIDNSRLTADKASWTGLSDTGIHNTAYASLIQFNIPGYTTPNYGLYEEYRFGQYTGIKGDKVPTVGGDKTDCYVIESKDAVAAPMYKEVTGKDDFASGTVNIAKSIGWFSEDGLVPEVGDYIIYSADLGTGEMKVVKIIYDASNEKADKDNFVATGIVRAYNTTEGVTTVTINETKYSYEYNDLLGNPFKYAVSTDKTWGPLYRAAFSRYFKTLFNQYVKYVVVDGKLVWVEKANASNQLIVVDSYAGLSSDGYIVVNGYKTDDLKYSQFRIGSYNSWVKGDYYYYLTDEKVEDSFRRGSLYRITSYDDKNNVYYVFTVAKKFVSVETAPTYETDDNGYIVHVHYIDKDGKETIVPAVKDEGGKYVYMSYDFADGLKGEWQTFEFADGYRSINGAAYEKTNAKDTYVLVCNPIDDYPTQNNHVVNKAGGDYAPIIVYTGRVTAKNWYVEGFRISGTGDNSYVLVGVDFNKIVGFDADQYDISYVLFLHYDYTKAAYDSADADGWYLLGASNFEATVFNWYNGEIETKTAVNKDLKMGYSYPSINGVIVNDARYAARDLDKEIPGAYQWQWEINSKNTPHYLFGCSTDIVDYAGFVGLDSKDEDTYKAAFNKYFDKENFSKYVVSPAKKLSINVKDLVSSIKVFLVTADATRETVKEVERVDAAAMSAWARDNGIKLDNLFFWWIMDKNGNVVVYIDYNSAKPVAPVLDYEDEVGTGLVDVKSSGAYDTDEYWFGESKNTTADTDEALISGTVSGIFDGTTDVLKKLTTLKLRWTSLVDVKAAETSDAEEGEATGNAAAEDEEEAETKVIKVVPIEVLSHKEVDVKDFHFGRTGYCEKENFWFKLNGERIFDSIDANGEDCVITEVYDAQNHDETTCDLIQELTFDISSLEFEFPDYDIVVVDEYQVPEGAIKLGYCGGGCICRVPANDTEIEVMKYYGLSADEIAELVAEANKLMAEQATTEDFTLTFRDSSDTTYEFTITLYIAPTVKAVTDPYGHTELVFDKFVYAVDFTDANVAGENYDFDSKQPEYKDRFVTDQNRADAELPPFDLTTFEYTLEW